MNKEIYYFRESAVQSIIADFITFLFLGVLFAFNHFYMNDSKLTAFVFFIVFIIFTIGQSNAIRCVFTDREALIKHLQQEEN